MNPIIDETVLRLHACFQFDSEPESCHTYGSGHINRTYLVQERAGSRYILQRISEGMGADPEHLMANIAGVTGHLRRKEKDPRRVLSLVPTVDGKPFLRDETGCWRAYRYVEGSVCLQTPESAADFYQSALAFGRFMELLKDYPIEDLYETIPDFHNTPKRYQQFKKAVAEDAAGRKKDVGPEIEFILAREEEMGLLQKLREEHALPTRVTHNDTKLNNVLFDARTREALCVIDLDTVMPGLSLYDFGDSIRFGAATAAEDERDLSRMCLNLEYYKSYRDGFLLACPDLTAAEKELLPMGAKTMTLECGMRFLADYLEGDHYFQIDRPHQNLDRCRTQLKLISEMERQWDTLCTLK